MTIKETIANYHIHNLQIYLQKLYQVKAPKIVVKHWEEQLVNYQKGLFKVKGLSRKYQVSNVEVKIVDYKKMKTWVYSTVEKRRSAKSEPTTVIRMETDKGTYYYDATNNQIGKGLMELNVISTATN